jgi:hypothetical protein
MAIVAVGTTMPHGGPVIISRAGSGTQGGKVELWVEGNVVMYFSICLREDFDLYKEYCWHSPVSHRPLELPHALGVGIVTKALPPQLDIVGEVPVQAFLEGVCTAIL